MNRYEPSAPRAAFAVAAIALTAITLGLSVIIPAQMNTQRNDAPERDVVSDAPTRVLRIDVIAVRDRKVASSAQAHQSECSI